MTLRITPDNIKLVAALTEIAPEKIAEKLSKARSEYFKQQQIEAACEFFGKEEAWYHETMKKVKEIGTSLPEDMDPKERIIQKYGWIADAFPDKPLYLPPIGEEMSREFMRAESAHLILTNYDVYVKCKNLD